LEFFLIFIRLKKIQNNVSRKNYFLKIFYQLKKLKKLAGMKMPPAFSSAIYVAMRHSSLCRNPNPIVT
jgi:hypothetical protein